MFRDIPLPFWRDTCYPLPAVSPEDPLRGSLTNWFHLAVSVSPQQNVAFSNSLGGFGVSIPPSPGGDIICIILPWSDPPFKTPKISGGIIWKTRKNTVYPKM